MIKVRSTGDGKAQEVNPYQFKVVWQYMNLMGDWETLDYTPKPNIIRENPNTYRQAVFLI